MSHLLMTITMRTKVHQWFQYRPHIIVLRHNNPIVAQEDLIFNLYNLCMYTHMMNIPEK
jgi:hypothetical protein